MTCPCPVCKKPFRRKRDVDAHLKAVHKSDMSGFESGSSLKAEDNGTSKTTHNCDVQCGYSARTLWHLREHIRGVHLKMKPFKCSQCGHETSKKINLRRHIKTVHEKIKSFQCEHCGYSSSNKRDLDIHINSFHKSFKPFSCNECKYATAKESNLRSHVKSVHEKIKPFLCEKCPFLTHNKSYLKCHLKTVHEKLRSFQLIHLECVKSFAPYVDHLVLDLTIETKLYGKQDIFSDLS